MKSYKVLFGLALAVGMAGTPAVTFAEGVYEGGGGTGSSLIEARKQILALKTQEQAAKAQLDRSRAKVLVTFKAQNPEYAKAEADLAKSKLEMDQAKAAAQTAVRSTAEYRAAAAAKQAAQDKLRSLQDARGSTAELIALQDEFIKHATVLNRLETNAVAMDPRYNDAKTRNIEAARVLEGFKPQIDDACLLNPEYATLYQTWQAAQQQVVQAEDSLKQTMAAERAARAAEMRAKASERSSERRGGGE